MIKDAIVQDHDPNHLQKKLHADIMIGVTHHLLPKEGKLSIKQFVRFSAELNQEMKG
jgi:uncharacterized protein (DUF2249 family)